MKPVFMASLPLTSTVKALPKKADPGGESFSQIFNQKALSNTKNVQSGHSQRLTSPSMDKALPYIGDSSFTSTASYTVKKGDSLWTIGERLKTEFQLKQEVSAIVDKLAKSNNIADPAVISIGQIININALTGTAKPRVIMPKPNTIKRGPANITSQKTYRPVKYAALPMLNNSIKGQVKTNFKLPKVYSNNLGMDPNLAKVKKNNIKTPSETESASFVKIIDNVSQKKGVSPALSQAIARTESGVNDPFAKEAILDPKAFNPDGNSYGLFQLINETGQRHHRLLGMKDAYNPFNPGQNIEIGIGYLKYLDGLFSDESTLSNNLNTTPVRNASERQKFMAAAFNAGEGSVARAQQKALAQGKDPTFFQNIKAYLPSITQYYVDKVQHIIATIHSYAKTRRV